MRGSYEHSGSNSIYSNADLYGICNLHTEKVR
nr:MAG TPA: hypothetical protein [Caudoviricetes sp.]